MASIHTGNGGKKYYCTLTVEQIKKGAFILMMNAPFYFIIFYAVSLISTLLFFATAGLAVLTFGLAGVEIGRAHV